MAVPSPPLKVSGYAQITNDGTSQTICPRSSAYPLATDGSRVYFVESPFLALLRQVSAVGGDTAAIPTSFRLNRIGDISPDRSVTPGSGFYCTRTRLHSGFCLSPPGHPAGLGDLSGHDGTWSPDGQHVLFANGRDLFWPSLMGPNPLSWRPLPVLSGGRAGRPTDRIFAFQFRPAHPEPTLSGKCRPTGQTFILCFPAGTIRRRIAAATGHQTESTTSFSPLAPRELRSGRWGQTLTCSARAASHPVDQRAGELFHACAQRGRKAAVCPGLAAKGRTPTV